MLITAVLFALAHGVQNFPLFFDRLAFGLIAGWLVIRTGGLEAGIALHVLNNFLAFGIALAFGDTRQTLNVTEVSLVASAVTVTQSACTCVLVLLVARRMGLPAPPTRRRAEPGAAPAGAVDRRVRTPRHAARLVGETGVRVSSSLGRPAGSLRKRADPMGYGVIGSPTGSGPVSLGSSPSTPASTSIWLALSTAR